jgi:arylsulfatase A
MMMYLTRLVYITAISSLVCYPLLVTGQAKSTLPNIVYILADDLGYGDVSIYNPAGKINTPNIDKLAREGMRFTDAHTTSSVCTPSRYSILTGRYPWRSRLPIGVLRGYSRTLIEPELPTVAKLLKTKSYKTGVVGKWHLGLDWIIKDEFKDSLSAKYNPNNLYGITKEMNPDLINFFGGPVHGPDAAGFDYSYILPASLDMPPYCYLENGRLTEIPNQNTPGKKLHADYSGPFWRPGLVSPSFDFYDVLPGFTRKATEFIQKQSVSNTPFFLYFPMPAPHTPWVPTPAYAGKSKAGEYGDFMMMVDDAVGKVLEQLERSGVADNTLVIFTSDNGPYWGTNFVQRYKHASAGPFRGMKGDAYEGGHRVPFIVRYPGKVKSGTTSNTTISLASLMATLAELIGNKSSEFIALDSYSILPVLLGKRTTIPEQPGIVNISSKGFLSIREGSWKLITRLGSGGFTEPSEIPLNQNDPIGQLYNLESDVVEDKNVYLKYPSKVKELNALLEQIKNAK